MFIIIGGKGFFGARRERESFRVECVLALVAVGLFDFMALDRTIRLVWDTWRVVVKS